MRFLVDAQLPPALAVWLREQGHEAQAVREVGLREAGDGAIWAHALQTSAVILTKDEDFAARSQQTSDGPAVVWLRVGNVSKRPLHDGRMTPDFNYTLKRSLGGDSCLHGTETRPRVCEPSGKALLTYYVTFSDFVPRKHVT